MDRKTGANLEEDRFEGGRTMRRNMEREVKRLVGSSVRWRCCTDGGAAQMEVLHRWCVFLLLIPPPHYYYYYYYYYYYH